MWRVLMTSVGNDLRKAVFDGWPVENAIGFDLHSGNIISQVRK